MAIGAIELTTISRSQDYTAIKHNEDNKGVLQQSQIGVDKKQQIDHNTKQVLKKDDVSWQQKKFDAKDKGNGSYQGDGGKKRQKDADGKVIAKGYTGFDIKI